MKCAGLDDAQLKLRACEPSTLSLLGLVRHMTEVERGWFRRHIGGEQVPPMYYTDQAPDDDFDALDSTPVAEVFERYEREVELCRQALDGVPFDQAAGERSVRWIVSHMVEEYARHNGHADLLRERIDGAIGD
jgi:hypothetical protein